MQNTCGKELGASPERQCCAVHLLCSELDEAPNSAWQTWDAFVRQEEAGTCQQPFPGSRYDPDTQVPAARGPHSREMTSVMVP